MNTKVPNFTGVWRFDAFIVIALTCILGVGFTLVSQGYYEEGDEGVYLLTFQLINLGKRPYLDFFFFHGPIYVYTNAAWLWLFGGGWRSAHLLSALLTCGCAAMMSAFFFHRADSRGWRTTLAILAPLLLLANVVTIHWGIIAQPYGWCVAVMFAGFLLTVRAVERAAFSAIWAGLASGLAASAYLLTGPMLPVLFFWIATQVAKAERKKKCIQFAAGTGLGFLPLGVFAAMAPKQTVLNVVAYHLTGRFKAPLWPGQGVIPTLTGWLYSSQGVLLALLSLIGVIYAFGKSSQGQSLNRPMRLSALITLCVGIVICSVRPTFPHYFILIIPFVTILACYGVYAIGKRICSGWQPIWLVLIIVGIFAWEARKTIREQLAVPGNSWQEIEEVAEFINRTVPAHCPIYADDAAIYAMAKRVPPSGLENNYSTFLSFGPETSKLLHVVSQHEIDDMTKSGRFCAVVTWSRERAEALQLGSLYRQNMDFRGHLVFWEWASPLHQP